MSQVYSVSRAVTEMSSFPSNILTHFAPFHEWLDEIVALSGHAFAQGGMNWRVDFSKRTSDVDKGGVSALKDSQQFSSPENINDINLMWSRFYWNAAGLGGSLQNLASPEEWPAEETKLTLDHLKTVEFVAALFSSAQASGYWVSFEENRGSSMKINTSTIFGKRVLEHSLFWSVD